MLDRDAERRLLADAGERHGLFTTEQVVALGLGLGLVRRRLEAGQWLTVLRGVYMTAGQPVTYRQRLLAAVLFNGRTAVASHRAAAYLWGLPGFGSAPVEVSKQRGRNQRRAYGLVHGSLHLPVDHLTVRDAIPVTSPARTLFDLAGIVYAQRAERTVDNALAARLCTIGKIEVVFASLAKRGRRGTAVMRALLEVRGGGYVAPSSELEALGRTVLREWGLPEPEVETDLGDGSAWIGRVDLLYRNARLVIELDSRRHHSALLDHRSDQRRDNRFMARGWRVLRYTWWDLVERPDEIVAEIRLALRVAPAA